MEDIKNRKVPSVTIDPPLDKLKEQNLFPEKLAKANDMLKITRLPAQKHGSQYPVWHYGGRTLLASAFVLYSTSASA